MKLNAGQVTLFDRRYSRFKSEARKLGAMLADGGMEIATATLQSLIPGFRDLKRPPLPFDQWPQWAKDLAAQRTPEDKGIGDVLARKIPFGENFKSTFKAVFGVDCGCVARQESLNHRFSFDQLTQKQH